MIDDTRKRRDIGGFIEHCFIHSLKQRFGRYDVGGDAHALLMASRHFPDGIRDFLNAIHEVLHL